MPLDDDELIVRVSEIQFVKRRLRRRAVASAGVGEEFDEDGSLSGAGSRGACRQE